MLQVDLDDDGVHWLKEAQEKRKRETREDLKRKIQEKERQKWRSRKFNEVLNAFCPGEGPRDNSCSPANKGTGELKRSKERSRLSETPVAKTDLMNSGDHINMVYKMKLGDGTVGIFKPQDEDEEQLRDFIEPGRSIYRDIAASEIADILDMDDLVPAVVERQRAGDMGAFREFVDGDVAADSDDPYNGIRDLSRAGAFSYLIGNQDGHNGNWFVKKDGSLALTDHDLAFPSKHDAPMENAMILTELETHLAPIPKEVAKWGEKWNQIEVAMKARHFNEKEIKATKERLDALVDASKDRKSFADLKRTGPVVWFPPKPPAPKIASGQAKPSSVSPEEEWIGMQEIRKAIREGK